MLSTDPDSFYEETLEPLLGPLNEEAVDFSALRAKLPKAAGKTTKRAALAVDETTVAIHRGTLELGSLTFTEGGILLVLGDCRVTGGVFAPPHVYTALVVGGTLTVDRLHTSGDLVAFGGIQAEVLWGSGNDYSTYAPRVTANVLVASEDRSTVSPAIKAKASIVGFDVDAKIAKRFPGLDPKDDASIREFCKIPKSKTKAAGAVTPALRNELVAELVAARSAPRLEHVKRVRAVYATIKKKHLVSLGDVLVTQVLWKTGESTEEWSVQDELQLLAALGRADLLVRLRDEYGEALEGYDGWWPNLLAIAKKASA